MLYIPYFCIVFLLLISRVVLTLAADQHRMDWLSGTSAVVVIFPADEDLCGRNVLDFHVFIDATIKVD